MIRTLFALAGIFLVGLGWIGVFVPILPSTPFFLAAAFCFARSSRRLDRWFKGTSIYRNHLKDFSETRTMTRRSKALVIATVTAVMGLGFAFMGNAPVARIILALVWIAHLAYFLLRVKTPRAGESTIPLGRDGDGAPV